MKSIISAFEGPPFACNNCKESDRDGGVSAVQQELNERRYQEAADEFLRWVYCNGRRLRGLVLRRTDERALFWPEFSGHYVLDPLVSVWLNWDLLATFTI